MRTRTRLGAAPENPDALKARRELAREMNAFSRQVERAIAGQPINRGGQSVPNGETVRALREWDAHINHLRQNISVKRNWPPLRRYMSAGHRLLLWMDGVIRTPTLGGGELKSKIPRTGAISTRLSPMPDQFGPRTDRYYDDPLHDK